MKLFAGGIAFLVLSLLVAQAQDGTVYIGNASGSFEDPSDFSNGAPNANLYTEIITGGEFTQVGVNGTVNGVDTFTITESANDQTAGLFVESGFEINTNSTVPGTVNLVQANGTTLTIGQNYDDGLFVANQVSLNISGGTVDVVSGGIIVGFGDFASESGESGLGTLKLSSETFNFAGIDNVFDVGFDTEGVGIVTEAGSSVVSGDDIVIGAMGATGTYNLQGGTLNINDKITLGDISGSVGTLNQTGGTFTDTSTTEAFVVGEAGNGTYLISGGTAVIDGNLSVGDSAGGSGTVTQSGGSVTIDGDALIGNQGNGTYNLSEGTATFNGNLLIGNAAGSTGNFNQSGGVFTVSMETQVGVDGTGTFTFSGGTANFAEVMIGENADSTGSFNQTGGNLTFTSTVDVGVRGTGTYHITGGTSEFEAGLVVGDQSGSTGTVRQSGGTLTIASGQVLSLAQANSSYDLDGGTLVVGDTGGAAGIVGAGTLNFAGGTLQSQGATLTDSANGTIDTSATISAVGSTVNLEGNLNGAGQLVISGDGATVVNLTGTDTYQGGTTINDGVLNAAITSLPDSGPLAIASGATLNLTGAGGSRELFSSLSGAGTFNTGAYNLELTGNLNFTGTTTIGNGGSLQVFNGSLGNFGVSTGSLEIGGDDSVATTGTVTLTGTNAFTGATTINQGFTLLAKSLASAEVTNMGSMGSTGTVGNVFLIGGGTGNLNQPSSANPATLLVRLAGPSFDSYTAGTASLFGDIGVSGYGRIGTTTYTIVNTAGLTTGALNQVGPGGLIAVSSSPVLLQATLTESGTQLFLDVTQRPITDFADTPNQRSVANALDAGLFSPNGNTAIFSDINSLTAAEIPGALDQLTPRPYLYMRDIAFENSTFLAQRVDGALANIRTGFSGLDTNGLSVLNPGMESNLGQSLGSLLAYNNERPAPNGVNYYPVSGDSSDIMQMPGPSEATPPATISDSGDPRMAPTVGPPPSTSIFDGRGSGFNEFISGDVILGDLNQNQSNNNEPKAHYTAGNATAGVSFRMASNLAAGVLFDYNHTDAKTDTQDSRVKVDSYSPGLFATFFEKGFYANGLFTFGYNNYSDDRNISFGGAGSRATSSPSGQQYALNLSGGYDFHPNPHWVIGPTASLGYTHLDVDSFTENGAGPADLSVASQSADSLRGRIGGRVLYQVHAGSILFQPNLSLSYQHEFLDNDFNLDSQLNIPGTPGFTSQGTNSGRDTGLISIGLTATLDASMSLYLDYLAEYGGDDYFVQSVEGGLKASF